MIHSLTTARKISHENYTVKYFDLAAAERKKEDEALLGELMKQFITRLPGTIRRWVERLPSTMGCQRWMSG